MMQANETFSTSCDNSQRAEAFHHPVSMVPPQPHALPSQSMAPRAGFGDFQLFHDEAHDSHTARVSDTWKGAFQPDMGSFFDQQPNQQQRRNACGPATSDLPTLETGRNAGVHGEAPTESASMLTWYRSIIAGLSEENTSLSSQLAELKRENAQLKASVPSYHAQGQYNGYAEQNTPMWQDPIGSIAQCPPSHPSQLSGNNIQPLAYGTQQQTWGYEPSVYVSQTSISGNDPPSQQQHRSSTNAFFHPPHAEVKRVPHGSTTKEGDDSSSDDGVRMDGEQRPCYWTQAEHQRFLEALAMYKGHRSPQGSKPGQDKVEADGTGSCAKVSVGLGLGIAQLIATHVRTRKAVQVRSHAQKYFLKEDSKAKKQSDKRKRREDKLAAAAKHRDTAGQRAPEQENGAPALQHHDALFKD
eukprot:3671460-Rhodomonas_salina.1